MPFADHPLVVIAPPDAPAGDRPPHPARALADQTFLVREQGSGTRSSMERFFAERGFVPKIGNVMSSNETIKQAVMADMGLAFISRHTIGFELQMGRLVELDIVGLPLMRRWYVVHRAGRFMSRGDDGVRRFRRRIGARAPGRAASLRSRARRRRPGSRVRDAGRARAAQR